MNKLFLVDAEIRFLDIIQSITFTEEVDIQVYTTCKDILQIISRELPDVIFLCLDINDVDEFILHDIMKISHSNNRIPIVVTYSDKSSEIIQACKKLRYQPDEYLKKPVSEDKVREILLKYFNMENETAGRESGKDNKEGLLDESEDQLERTDSLFNELIEQEKEEFDLSNVPRENREKKDQGIFIVHDGKIDQSEEEIVRLRAEIKRLEGEKKIAGEKFSRQEKELGKRIAELEKRDSSIQKAQDDEIEKLKSHYAREEKKKEELFGKRELEYTDKISSMTDQIKQNAAKIKKLSNSEDALQDQVNEKEAELEKAHRELSGLKKMNSEKIKALVSSIEQLKKNFTESEKELGKIKSIVEELGS